MNTVARRQRVDLGLALLCIAAIPGRPLTRRDLAAWCDCTSAGIHRLEQQALRKLANRIRFGSPRERELLEYLFAA